MTIVGQEMLFSYHSDVLCATLDQLLLVYSTSLKSSLLGVWGEMVVNDMLYMLLHVYIM